MSSWQPIQYCRSNGTDQHSWTASDGTRYESCYNWKGNGSEGSGNAVGRNSNGTCNYPSQATHAYCVPTNAPASNTTCPDRFKSSNGACEGTAYGVDVHGFSGYSKTRKAQWACNAGEGVTWEAVLPNKPSGKTWWIGDENGGYCTNNKVEILTKGKCGVYGQIIDMTSPEAQNKSWYECRYANGFTKYNPYNFKPGDKDAMASQILANTGFETKGCWFSDDNWPHEKATYEGKLSSNNKHELKINMRCYFPELHPNRLKHGDNPMAYCRSGKGFGGPKGYRHPEWFNAEMKLNFGEDWLAKKLDPNNDLFVGKNKPYWEWGTPSWPCRKNEQNGFLGFGHNHYCQGCSFECNKGSGMRVSEDLQMMVQEDPDQNRDPVRSENDGTGGRHSACPQGASVYRHGNTSRLKHEYDKNIISIGIWD